MRAGLVCSDSLPRRDLSTGCDLLLRREGADFGLALRVGKLAQFLARTASDRSALVAGLETGEVRPVFPGERTASLLPAFIVAS